jgi:hypothetical protein
MHSSFASTWGSGRAKNADALDVKSCHPARARRFFGVVFRSAGAQGSLEQGKTAAQLYAANCASCHKSPQSVTKATGIFGLENYLREHYTPSPQSAAIIAAYLDGLERQSSGSGRARGAKQSSQANAPKPSPSETKEDKSAVSRALNSAADTAERALNKLLQAIKP